MKVTIDGVRREVDALEIEAFGAVYTVSTTDDGHLRLHAKNASRLAMRLEGPIASNAHDIRAHGIDVLAVTGATITDEQIHAVKAHIVARFERGADTREDRELQAIIASALNPSCHAPRRADARERIAAAYNAIHGLTEAA